MSEDHRGQEYSSRSEGELFGECRKISDILSRVGDKWSVYAIFLLIKGPMRFGELRSSIEGVSQRMLTITLRGLERDGLLTRKIYAVIPPKVEYQLTPMAISLVAVLSHLGNWAIDNYEAVLDARKQFDARSRG